MGINSGKFVIADQEGKLLCSIMFGHGPTARAHFEGVGEQFRESQGIPELEFPTIEWLPIEPPHWAHPGMEAWAGYTEDGTNPVIVAGLALEERALVEA